MLDPLVLASLRAAPRDDAPRLAVAAQLRAAGDPRGEFIELQCALASMRDGDEARAPLAAREAELLDAFADGWRAQAGLAPREGVFRRGFVDEVVLSWARLREVHGPLAEAEPVRSLVLTPASPRQSWLPELLEMPLLSVIASLGLARRAIGAGGAHLIANAPCLARLASLDLSTNGLGDEGAIAIASSPHLGALRTLALAGNRVGDEGAIALARSPTLANLTTLELSWNEIGDEGATALSDSPHLARLDTLVLNTNRVDRDGVVALANSPFWGDSMHLELAENRYYVDPLDVTAAFYARLRGQFRRPAGQPS